METEIIFNPSGRSGLIAVGSYLLDAAKRLGVQMQAEEVEEGKPELFVVQITQGADLLSPLTKFESEYLSKDLQNKGNRLASQAKIEKEGEVVVMVKEKTDKEIPTEEKKAKDARKEFEELPLEKKVAQLLELEMITLSDTFSFIFNSPYKVVDKVMDVMAEFGLKMEKSSKEANRPDEHKDEPKAEKKKSQSKKPAETPNEAS